MLELKTAAFQIGTYKLLQPSSIAFNPSTLYAVMGANGSGKSTLLRLLAGALTLTEGLLLYEGAPLHHLSRQEIAKRISCLPQTSMRASSLVMDLRVIDWVMMGCYPYKNEPGPSARYRTMQALRQVQMEPFASHFLHTLSQGQRQKVALARILVTQAPVYLLDEPTAHLDIYQRQWVWTFLQSAARQGKLVIVATHDVEMARQYADQAVLLRQGVLLAHGPCKEFLSEAHIKLLYHCQEQ